MTIDLDRMNPGELLLLSCFKHKNQFYDVIFPLVKYYRRHLS